MIQTETEVRSGILAWFSRNPWIGVLASVCSIVGLPLGFYFYFASQSARELTFAVSPVKTTVVNAGGTSALRIFHGDQELKTDVTAEQVAIWNAGKLPIRPENVLEPITLSLRPAAQILEVTVRKPARSAAGFRIDMVEMRAGRIGLTWKILEHEDGAVIQVLHTGRPGTEITVGGTVEGQPQIEPVRISALSRPYTPFQYVLQFVVAVLPGFILLPVVYLKRFQVRDLLDRLAERGVGALLMFQGILLAVGVSCSMLILWFLFPTLVPPPIPFAF